MARKPGAVVQIGRHKRPIPPADLCDPLPPWKFVPAPEMTEWLMAVFVNEGGPLSNPEHAHLRQARIAVLWTNTPLQTKMNPVVGMAEIPQFRGNAWTKGRQDQQIEEWFGYDPDFLLTFDAAWWSRVDDASACATMEHELFHCAQALDQFGAPKFNKQTGRPVFSLRGHDVEEFVGVVERYGAGHGAGRTADLVRVANKGPTIAPALIGLACGTCGRKMA